MNEKNERFGFNIRRGSVYIFYSFYIVFIFYFSGVDSNLIFEEALFIFLEYDSYFWCLESLIGIRFSFLVRFRCVDDPEVGLGSVVVVDDFHAR